MSRADLVMTHQGEVERPSECWNGLLQAVQRLCTSFPPVSTRLQFLAVNGFPRENKGAVPVSICFPSLV